MPHSKPISCTGCPAFKVGKGFVPPEGPPNATVVLLGQGPGQDEYLDGHPFVGAAGRKLDYWLGRAGLVRHKLGVGNTVQCWLPGNREPTPSEVAFCREAHWGPWLAHFSQAKVVVPIGMSATTALLGKGTRSGVVGVVCSSPPTNGSPPQSVVLPVAHPSFILRGNFSEEPAQIEYLKHVRDLSNMENPSEAIRSFSEPPAGIQYNQAPTLTDLSNFRDSLGSGLLAVDIETAGDHLRLVGLYDIGGRSYLGFPVRSVGGGQYWGPAEQPSAVEWLWDLLADSTVEKCFHNGQAFDVPVLERNGFVVEGYWFDTMLAAHVAYPGVPKGLEELAKVHLRAGGWKQLVKVDGDTGEGK